MNEILHAMTQNGILLNVSVSPRKQKNQKNKHLILIRLCSGRLEGSFKGIRIMVMVFNATFNNISVILWWSVLLMEETGVPGENHRPVASH